MFNKYDLQNVVLDMIDHFIEGTGTSYSNSNLTAAVENHKETQRYMEDVTEQYMSLISSYKDKLEQLDSEQARSDMRDLLANNKIYLSSYSYDGWDNITGLEMAIHSWTQSDIYLNELNVYEDSYSGTLHFVFIDTFGLDTNDVERYGLLAGFRAWYVLQHYDKYKGKYKPFDTVVEIDYSFEGKF